MKQGVIECFNRYYKKHLMRKFIQRCNNTKNDLLNAYKNLNKKECIYLVAKAWDIINSTLKNG